MPLILERQQILNGYEKGQITEKVRPADVARAFPTNIRADDVRHLMEKEFDGME